jgi:hypothetical protein
VIGPPVVRVRFICGRVKSPHGPSRPEAKANDAHNGLALASQPGSSPPWTKSAPWLTERRGGTFDVSALQRVNVGGGISHRDLAKNEGHMRKLDAGSGRGTELLRTR